jgi:peptidoglycan LD-endopeptidase LytH
MRRQPRRHLALAFGIGFAVLGILLLAGSLYDTSTRSRGGTSQEAVGTSGRGAASPATPARPAPPALPALIADLRQRDLRVPIDGADVERWKGSFEETHGDHKHEAVDILAPRDTPIHAVAEGRIAKLFVSKAGGLTVYELDASQRYIYYYAHLDHYAEGLQDGDTVTRGQVIGYVGTSGNAPPDTPHLHFTIFRVADPRRWWKGTAIDPYEVYTGRR